MRRRFAILPGDGIGVDVTREAVKVLKAAASKNSIELERESFDYGAERYLKTGETLPGCQVVNSIFHVRLSERH